MKASYRWVRALVRQGSGRAAEVPKGLNGCDSTHSAEDGGFRRVKVSLNGGVAGELSYRQGYFTGIVKDDYRYTIQNVGDTTAQKAAFWQAPIVLVP